MNQLCYAPVGTPFELRVDAELSDQFKEYGYPWDVRITAPFIEMSFMSVQLKCDLMLEDCIFVIDGVDDAEPCRYVIPRGDVHTKKVNEDEGTTYVIITLNTEYYQLRKELLGPAG